MVPVYGCEALRQLRQRQAAAQEPERQPSLLEQIPPDAPMDDATITVWNGERFVAYDKWLATAPLVVEQQPPEHEERIAKGTRIHETADAPSQGGLWDAHDAADSDGR
jgi:hypothetical protein